MTLKKVFPVFVVVAVLGLLGALGYVQYNWQKQASDAERERMQRRTEMDTKRLAEDFNREIQGAYFNFHMTAEAWRKGDHSEFSDRYDFWKSKTAYPELIRDFYFLPEATDAPVVRYDPNSRQFVPAEITPQLSEIRSRIAASKNVPSVYEDLFTLILPVHDAVKQIDHVLMRRTALAGELPAMHMPERFGELAIMLDPAVIRDRIMPDLVTKYFPDGDFNVSIANKSGEQIFGSTSATDASAGMLDLSAESFVIYSTRDALPRSPENAEGDLIINERIERKSFAGEGAGHAGIKTPGSSVKFEVQNDAGGLPRTQIFTNSHDTATPWLLSVQHRDGSIAAVIDSRFRKDLAIGGSLFALLAAAILGIFFSAQRAKAFAQRQVDFVSSVSHEFRTPLAVIYSAGENLADGVASDVQQVSRYGDLIKGEGKKLSAMVEQILDFAGANAGNRRYRFAPTNISDVVGDALEHCSPLLESRGVRTELSSPDTLPAISGDRDALSRAVQNLIGNSLKYSGDTNWLRVATTNGGSSVKIVVEDKGIGISPSDLRHVFEPFFRAKNVVDAQIHGNGLGLALVKQIVEAHGGSVSAESEVGKGSRFVIELPIAKADSP